MKAGKGGKKGGTRRNRKKRKNSPGSILNCGKKKGGKERRWKKEEIEEGEPGALRNDSMLTIKWDFQYLPGKYYGDIRRSSRRMNPLFSRIISILSISRFRVRSNMRYRRKIISLYRPTRHRIRESFDPYNFRIARNLKYLSSRRCGVVRGNRRVYFSPPFTICVYIYLERGYENRLHHLVFLILVRKRLTKIKFLKRCTKLYHE